MKITTESGTVYLIREGQWKRNNGYWYPLHANYCVTGEANTWDMVQGEGYRMPVQVGLRMYTSAWDNWWLSTAIVSIEHEDSDYTEAPRLNDVLDPLK